MLFIIVSFNIDIKMPFILTYTKILLTFMMIFKIIINNDSWGGVVMRVPSEAGTNKLANPT